VSEAVVVRDGRKREFFMVDNAVILQHGRTIGPYGIAVYNALAMHAGRDGRCNPSVLTIANEIGASKRAVQGAIATLTEAGLLDVEVQPAGPLSTNSYVLNTVDAPGACGAPGALSAPPPGACGAPEQERTIPPFAKAKDGERRPRIAAKAEHAPAPHTALVVALLDELGESTLNFARHVRDAKALAAAGKTEGDVRRIVRWLLKTKGEFFATEPLTMTTVRKYADIAPKSAALRIPDGPVGDGPTRGRRGPLVVPTDRR
jgi:hypothetical protein